MYKLMIVEDHKWTRDGLAKTIPWEELGLSLRFVCEDGKQACEILLKQPVDLIITDIRMNEVDGIELTRFAKEKVRGVEVILISAYQDFDYARSALKLGAYAYIVKPIDRDELLQTVEAAVSKLKKDREQLKSNSAVSRKNLVEAFRDYLLKYTEDPALLQAELKHQGMVSVKPKFMVFLLKGLDRNTRYPRLRDQINIFEPSIVTFLHHDYLVGLYLMPGDMAIYSFRRTIRRLREESGLENLRICAGEPVESLYELSNSYEKANVVLNHCFLYGKKDVVYYSEIQEYLKQKAQVPQFDSEYILDCIEALKEKELNSYLERTGEAFRESEAMRGEVLARCTHLLELLGKGLEKYGLILDTMLAETGGNEQFEACEQLSGVIVRLQSLFEAAVDEIRRRRGKTIRGIVSGALDCIHNHYGEQELNLNWVSSRIGVNYSYLSKCFKEDLGMGFTEYVNRYRISVSKRFLKNSSLKLYEICDRIGIDYRYFNTLFREYENMSPMEYKKL